MDVMFMFHQSHSSTVSTPVSRWWKWRNPRKKRTVVTFRINQKWQVYQHYQVTRRAPLRDHNDPTHLKHIGIIIIFGNRFRNVQDVRGVKTPCYYFERIWFPFRCQLTECSLTQWGPQHPEAAHSTGESTHVLLLNTCFYIEPTSDFMWRLT